MNRIILAITVIFIFGCATASGPLFEKPGTSNDKSLLVAFRKNPELIYNGHIKINGNVTFELLRGGYSYIYLDPGVHKLTVGWPSVALIPPVTTEFDFIAGQRVYLEVKENEGNFSFQIVPENEALKTITAYRFIEPKTLTQ